MALISSKQIDFSDGISGTLNVTGSLIVSGSTHLTGSTSASGSFDVNGTATFGTYTGQSSITTVGTVTAGSVTAILPVGVLSGSAQLPVGTISGSIQVDHDATTNFVSGEHFLQSAITTVGTVNAGSIASGFGSINIGSSAFSTTGASTLGATTVSGSLTISGSLVVIGSTIEAQILELRIKDKLITLASGSVNGTTSDGAGIEIDRGSDPTVALTWNNTADRFNFNKGLIISGSTSVSGAFDVTGTATFGTYIGQSSIVTVGTVVAGSVTSILPVGTISGSIQVDHDATTNFVSGEHFLQSAITTVGTVNAGSVTAILPVGSISGSIQVDHDATTNFVSGEHFIQSAITTVGTVNAGSVTAILPVGSISGSIQVDHDATTNFVSGEHFLQSAITTVGTVNAGSVTAILPVGVLSGSAQLPVGTISGSIQVDHDATTNFVSGEHFLQSAIVEVGTLNAGSIASGFGSINIGSSTFSTTGTVDTGQLTVTGTSILNGNAQVTGSLDVTGAITGLTKSFKIKDPVKGGSLIYGSVEAPEHSVSFRGKATTDIIELPEAWEWLVDSDTITCQLTPIGNWSNGSSVLHWVRNIEDGKIFIDSETSKIECFYLIHATRKDVEPLQINQ